MVQKALLVEKNEELYNLIACLSPCISLLLTERRILTVKKYKKHIFIILFIPLFWEQNMVLCSYSIFVFK